MKPLRPADLKRAVDAASRALTAALETRHRVIEPSMLNSAGSVSAEWYVETLWHYLAKRALLKGVSSIDVVFEKPARLTDKTLHFALPHPDDEDLVMDFHVLRKAERGEPAEKVPVARLAIHRGQWRRRHGLAPDPPLHPYGIEVRTRHLNSARQVSWHTMVSMMMDVARRGLQLEDDRFEPRDTSALYIVPRFTFTPLAEAAAQDNLFIYPSFEPAQGWTPSKTSASARVTFWAIANDDPWPLTESLVTVVRTCVVNGERRPVDELGRPKSSRPQ